MATASWYHCSVKPVSRSAGRSVVAAAAYRLGERLHDERYDQVQDYTRRRGVESTFTMAPVDAPKWALNPEALWNAAEQAETRKNSTLAREVELALPSMLSAAGRRQIAEKFAKTLVERYSVAVSVAIHSASSKGDRRNDHAHILFTTREMLTDGLGRKTRVLDDRKSGPKEVIMLRKLAADLINEGLASGNSDIRVDHRSFKDRGIEQQPTAHLGPAASGIERRRELSSRGDLNRSAQVNNALIADRQGLDKEIAIERNRIASPPQSRADAQARAQEDAAPLVKAIAVRGKVPDIEADGLRTWQRAGMRLAEQARNFALAIALKARDYWQQRQQHSMDDRGLDR